MITSLRYLFVLLTLLGLAACKDDRSTPSPQAPAGTSTPPAATTTPAPASQPARIGIAACDDYLRKYETCLTGNVPASARDSLRQSFEQTRNAWLAAAGSDAGKASLAETCANAARTARESMGAYGCTDF